MLGKEILECPLQMLELLLVGARVTCDGGWGACKVRVVVEGGGEEEGVERAEGLRCGGEVEEGLRLGGLDGKEGSEVAIGCMS